jgi:KinB signaling pathway activation protein
MEKQYKILVVVWMFFSAGAFVLQVFFQDYLAGTTAWGFSPGWQREIGFWNLGIIFITIQILRLGIPVKNTILPAILILSALFAGNHYVTGSRNPSFYGHMIAYYLNIIPIMWAFILYTIGKTKKNI